MGSRRAECARAALGAYDIHRTVTMKSRLIVALAVPLITSGCMMAGMAGMGVMGHMTGGGMHAGNAAMPVVATEVSEVVAGGLRISAEFPVQVTGDTARFGVVLRELDGRDVATDAAVFLDVVSSEGSGASVDPAPAANAHSMAMSHPSPSETASSRTLPYGRTGGRFEFRLARPTDAAIRATIVVERVGARVMDPPISVSRVVQFAPRSPRDAHAGAAREGSYALPLAALGGALMVVMMVLVRR